jgi:hypothetical protein
LKLAKALAGLGLDYRRTDSEVIGDAGNVASRGLTCYFFPLLLAREVGAPPKAAGTAQGLEMAGIGAGQHELAGYPSRRKARS